FNIPQHMLGLTDKSTFSNMEQEALEFLKFTVFPECRRWEAAFNYQLLTPSEIKKGYEIKYVIREIDRADTATRFASYAVGRQWGFLAADEIREREDYDPIPDGDGKIFLQPVNMVDVSEEKEDPQPLPVPGLNGVIQVPTTAPIQPAQPPGQGDAPGGAPVNTQPGKRFIDRTRKAYTRMFEAQISGLLTKEAKFVDRIAKKCASDRDVGDFRKQVESFYQQHEQLCSNEMLEHFIALGEQVTDLSSANETLIRRRAAAWSAEHCRVNRERIVGLIETLSPEKLLPAVADLAKQWQEREFSAVAEKQVAGILDTLEIAA
ncbi:MAG: phage portal protein, partial [Ktedonobacteraceae bacterium]